MIQNHRHGKLSKYGGEHPQYHRHELVVLNFSALVLSEVIVLASMYVCVCERDRDEVWLCT